MESPQLVAFCGAECDWIAAAASQLASVDGGRLLKNYKTVSTGAYLGGQRSIWRPIVKRHPPNPEMVRRIDTARTAITALAVGSPGVAAFCQRVEYGPLTYAVAVWNEFEPKVRVGVKEHRFRAHVMHDLGTTPAVLAGSSRWYCEYKSPEHNFGWPAEQLRDAAGDHIHVREQYRRALAFETQRAGIIEHSSLSTDVYLPGRFMTEFTRGYISECIDEAVIEVENPSYGRDGSMKRSAASYKRDQWRLNLIDEAPPCEACGWCVEDMDVS